MNARSARPARPKPRRRPQPRRRPSPASRSGERAGLEPFRVLIAAHRPRYRSRAERAVDLTVPGWEVRSLLNREDPIGLMNRQAPDLFVISVDPATNANVGYLRAAQRYRRGDDGHRMFVVGLFENGEQAAAFAEQCDLALAAPWRASDVRAAAARFYHQARGHASELPPIEEADE